MAEKKKEPDEAKMAAALKQVLETLNPLSKVERRRVLDSASVFLGEWRGKDPREHRGDHDCG